MLCTGRPLSGVKPYLEQLSISGSNEFAITFNGAMAQDLSGNVISHHTLSYEDFLRTEMFSRLLGSHYQIETTDQIIATNQELSPYTIGESYLVRLPIVFKTPEQITDDMVISKAMFVDHPEVISKIKANIPAELTDRLYVVQSEPYFIEMMNKNASKGNALKDLATRLDLKSDQVMAIGDEGNDLTMIEYAGMGVAMGNGIDEVKQAASFITKTNAENGVAFAINKYVNEAN
ncbi:promiscuous sugar phosphatase YidA, haloacid dehalogenase-like phosphatase family [Lentilactobacillus kosonis]|uniref:Promiscuous sugar phosphatase YidA, haloacid dehalogenase-like phosphatase family n=1 Tax=Lentilactobacillus kosonis TaxID=2810561 RepID=A0A401FP95_9LACO|nr:promiscuous sugar phosphatase YidA, haloacid dehalogenase-like phosphatase family [Lentilactobacillus kosonis]